MHILVVGNVLKDVYLNIDSRTENFEQDESGTNWLDLGFNASQHHFFSRSSNFAGAAISLEVLSKMGLSASISDSDFHFDESGPVSDTTDEAHRYILTSDSGVTYFVPSEPKKTSFSTPTEPVDYLFIDRSANLTPSTVDKINTFIDYSKNTKLILYLKNDQDPLFLSLAHRANLIFLENNRGNSEHSDALASLFDDTKKTTILSQIPPENIVKITDNQLSYMDTAEPISLERIDTMTHLSAFSIAAATILGAKLIGRSMEDSLKLARINVENSTLNSCLTLSELDTIATSGATENNLELIAANLMLPKKGILAADESGGSIKKKFEQLDILDTFKNRHIYRDIFLTTPDIEKYLNGVILFDETAKDHLANGQSYPDYLISKRIIPGIKVDQGLEFYTDSIETYTKGLADLSSRLREYYQMGLRFAKWRAAFHLTLNKKGEIVTPSARAIEENCHILAEYAKKCQFAGLVPIVEPELVYDGDYDIVKSAEVTSKILDELFKNLKTFGVNLRACILKCNMVLAGKQQSRQSTPEEVGNATARVLKNHVPAELAGVVFLSGGQTVEQATDNLSAIIANGPFPWPVTFSFARALQDPALYTWAGDDANIEAARKAFFERLVKNTEIL